MDELKEDEFDLTQDQIELLTKIYISQGIRDGGVLKFDIWTVEKVQIIEFLLDQKYIKEDKWYSLKLYETTRKGDDIASEHLTKYVLTNLDEIISDLKSIPLNVVSFLVNYHFQGVMPLNPDYYWVKWNTQIVQNKIIWEYRTQFLKLFTEFNLAFTVNNYVSTRGGELREKRIVLSQHVIEYLKKKYYPPFSKEILEYMEIYDLLQDLNYLKGEDIDSINLRWYNSIQHGNYDMMKIHELFEITAERNITSKYTVGSLDKKFIEIYEDVLFKAFLEENIIDHTYSFLLNNKDLVISLNSDDDISITRIPMRYETVGDSDTKGIFLSSRDLEIKIRNLIKEKLGTGWLKQIRNRCPNVYNDWIDNSEKDKTWGIEPEADLLSYAEFGHYYQIFENFSGNFAVKETVKLNEVLAHIRIWVNNGRNPIMHSRILTIQKYYTTMSAIEYLTNWIEYQLKKD